MFDELSLYHPPSQIGLSTGEVWFKALSSPRIESFQQIVSLPDMTIGKALQWLFLAGGFGGLAAGLLQAAFNTNSFFGLSGMNNSGVVSADAIIGAFLGAVFFSVGLPFITLLNAGVVYITAKALGGKARYTELLFGFAAYQAPLVLLLCFLGAIPTIGCLSIPLIVYGMVLGVVVVRVVCEFETGKALLCNLAPVGVGGMFGVCVLFVALVSTIEIV